MKKALWAFPMLLCLSLFGALANGWRPGLSLAAPELNSLAASVNDISVLEATVQADEPTPLPPPKGARGEPAKVRGERGEQMRPTPDAEFALVYGEWAQGGFTDVLAAPEEGADRISQALLGDRVKVLEQVGAGAKRWSKVKLLDQGLEGWVPNNHLQVPAPEERGETLRYMVVRAPGIEVEGGPFLPFGTRLPRARESEAFALLLPDGRWVPVDLEEVRSETTPLTPLEASEALKGFREIRFQEGGNTKEAMDAAGFIHLFVRAVGAPAPRSLKELLNIGRATSLNSAQAGDIVFFSTFNKEVPRPVVLLEGGETFIAATPATGVGFGVVEDMRNREVLEVRRLP